MANGFFVFFFFYYREQRSKERQNNKNLTTSLVQAKAIERLLFARARSLEGYLSCLDDLHLKLQLHSILTALLGRKLRKAEAEDEANSRRSALIKSLGGNDRYEQVSCLVNAVKLLRTGQAPASPSLQSVGLLHSLNHSVKLTSYSPASDPVRRLYFGTSLVTAFDLSPIEDLDGIFWDKLITEAEDIVHDYRVWMNSQQMS